MSEDPAARDAGPTVVGDPDEDPAPETATATAEADPTTEAGSRAPEPAAEDGDDRTDDEFDPTNWKPLTWVGALVGAATALWITRGAWGPNAIGGGDVTAHLVRADFGIPELIAHGRLDGWFPRFMVGHQLFLFNGPGLTWLMAIPRLLTFGALSNAGALKVVVLASFALQPASVMYFVRSFGINRLTAALAGVLSLVVSVGFGVGMEAQFVNGLSSHQVAVPMFFVAFGAVLRAFDNPGRNSAYIAGWAVMALLITHLISVMVLVVMVPVGLLFRSGAAASMKARLRGLGGLAWAGVVAFGLSAFWLVPFWSHRDLRGPIVTWGTDPFDQRMGSILRGEFIFDDWVIKLVMVAWILVLLRVVIGKLELLPFVVIPSVFLVIAHVSLEYPGPGDVTLQLANRGAGYAGIIAMVPVAAFAALAVKFVTWALEGHRRTGIVLAAIAFALAVNVTLDHSKQDLAAEMDEATDDFKAAAEQIRELVPDGARFALTRDYPDEITRLGVIEPARWLAWASGVDTLNLFNPEASQAAGPGFKAGGPEDGQDIDDWVRQLRSYGVSHIVAAKPSVNDDLDNSDLVEEEWSRGEIAIYRVLDNNGDEPPTLITFWSDEPEVSFERDTPERLKWNIDAETGGLSTVAVGWSPKWHAEIDGEPVDAVEGSEGLIDIQMPPGEHELTLAYRPDTADRLGWFITLVTLGCMAIPPLVRRVRRFRDERAAGDGDGSGGGSNHADGGNGEAAQPAGAEA